LWLLFRMHAMLSRNKLIVQMLGDNSAYITIVKLHSWIVKCDSKQTAENSTIFVSVYCTQLIMRCYVVFMARFMKVGWNNFWSHRYQHLLSP
jgi:hypothetical protein